MQPLKTFKGLSPESQGQNLAMTVWYVPFSLSGAAVNASTSAALQHQIKWRKDKKRIYKGAP